MRGSAITEEQKLDFLELTRAGYLRPEAARIVGSTGSRFRALCNPEGQNYDERFARIYNSIHESGEHEANRLDRLREAAFTRAILESDRLLEKLMLIYDPHWEPLRTQRVDINANIESFVQQHFGKLNAEQIRQVIAWVKENGEENIIDALPKKELEAA